MAAKGEVIAEKYRLEERLGVGAMGSVWRATHVELGGVAAVKIIHQAAARDPRSLARFERESRLAAKIQSDHVVRVHDHGHHAGLPFIVMDYLRGEDLRQRLQERKKLSVAETARIVAQVARALTTAHDIGLVHRDIKPENIFIGATEGDDAERVRVLDFGIAKATDTIDVSQFDPTQTGAVVGTPYYLSPEQARGLKTVGPPADLWSLAVVAFECITGERPFSGKAMGPLIAKILHGKIPVPSELLAGSPAALDEWFKKALCREPEGRFATAADLAAALCVAAGVTDTESMTSRVAQVPQAALRTEIIDEPVQPLASLLTASTHSDAAATIALEDRSSAAITLALPDDAPAPPAPAGAPRLDPVANAPWPVAPLPRRRGGLVLGLVVLLIAGAAAAYLIVSTSASRASAPADDEPDTASKRPRSTPTEEPAAPSVEPVVSPSAAPSASAAATGSSAAPTGSRTPTVVKPWKHRTTLE